MEYVSLGCSGLKVSRLCMGTMTFGDQADERESIRMVERCLDEGINFYDTADMYNTGVSEEILGRALQGKRDEVVVATKVSADNTAPATLREHCEASLRRLQTDYIDLYQVHWPIRNESIPDAFATLMDLQAEGKIRAIGISNHGVQDLGEVVPTGAPIVSNQLHYNLVSRAIEAEIVPLCQENGMDVIAYMPMLQGLLVGLYDSPEQVPPFRARTRHFSPSRAEASRHGQPGAEKELFESLAAIRGIADDLGVPMVGVALAWVAAKPFVSTVLVGSRKVAQLTANLQAAADATAAFTPDVVAALDAATEDLRVALGNNPDYWQSGEDCRVR